MKSMLDKIAVSHGYILWQDLTDEQRGRAWVAIATDTPRAMLFGIGAAPCVAALVLFPAWLLLVGNPF